MRNTPTSQSNWPGLVLVVLLAAATISCGAAGTATNKGSQSASLELNAASLDFGSVSVGSSKSNSLTLTNSADAGGPSIIVSQITIAGAGFSGNIPALPLTLTGGQSVTLSLTFTPTKAGAATGALSIVVDGAGDAATVPLTGNGLAQGQLGVSPPSLNFGSVNVGSNKNLGGTLTAGSSTIHISSASWNGQGYAVNGISFPLTLTAGQVVNFTVNFAPQVPGNSNGSVSFISDASNSPSTQTFSGTGVQVIQHAVDLNWDPSADQVTGYNVYRGTTSGGPYAKLTGSLQPGTSYTDSTVKSGTTYFYVSTAVDANSKESVFSNEAKAIVPNP